MKKRSSTLITVVCILIALLLAGCLNGQGKTQTPQITLPPGEIPLVTLPPQPDAPKPQQTGAPQETVTPQQTTPAPDDPTPAPDDAQEPELDEESAYNSKEEVALYIHSFGHLPPNYVTKAKARSAGWDGGSLEKYYPGCSIGGDVFGNREGLLPTSRGRTYYECDIDTAGKSSRGAKRIIFSNDGLIYYTDDHYESFTLLYGEDGQ